MKKYQNSLIVSLFVIHAQLALSMNMERDPIAHEKLSLQQVSQNAANEQTPLNTFFNSKTSYSYQALGKESSASAAPSEARPQTEMPKSGRSHTRFAYTPRASSQPSNNAQRREGLFDTPEQLIRAVGQCCENASHACDGCVCGLVKTQMGFCIVVSMCALTKMACGCP